MLLYCFFNLIILFSYGFYTADFSETAQPIVVKFSGRIDNDKDLICTF